MMRLKRFLASVSAVALLAPAALALAKGSSNGKSCSSSSRAKGSSARGRQSASGKHTTAHVSSHAFGSSYGMRRSAGDYSAEAAAASPNTCPTCERDANGQMRVLRQSESDFMRETGYPYGRVGYALGYVVPLQCGGADEPKNMQWLTNEEAQANAKAPCHQ